MDAHHPRPRPAAAGRLCTQPENNEGPEPVGNRILRHVSGRYWDRTSDLFRVGKRAPAAPIARGGYRIRTGVSGTGRCLTSANPTVRCWGGAPGSRSQLTGPDHDPHLGKGDALTEPHPHESSRSVRTAWCWKTAAPGSWQANGIAVHLLGGRLPGAPGASYGWRTRRLAQGSAPPTGEVTGSIQYHPPDSSAHACPPCEEQRFRSRVVQTS